MMEVGTATVRAATDAGLLLDDGRTVRLAGIQAEESGYASVPAGTTLVLKQISTAPELVATADGARKGRSIRPCPRIDHRHRARVLALAMAWGKNSYDFV